MGTPIFMQRITDPLLDFIYPPSCLSCGRLLPDGRTKVCAQCWNSIPLISSDLPLFRQTRNNIIAEGYIDHLVSHFVFAKETPFQHIVHALKYQGYRSIGFDLGKLIAERLIDRTIEIDIILPVPLYKANRRERGFNQSACIANGISRIIGKPMLENMIVRTRKTQSQTGLKYHERRENVENAFQVDTRNAHHLSGKRCLLVDDVITTGATTNACAQALRNARVKTVIAASAALAE